MDDFKIIPINAVNIHKVLTSSELTDAQKAVFLRRNSKEINAVMKTEISKSELSALMQNRPLQRFRPIKNSFTKHGDKMLLAKSLGVSEKDINKYIDNIISTNFDIQNGVTSENIDKVKAYVYRHGSKSQVVAFLGYELSNVDYVLKRLYKTLEDNSGGLADYFSRPVHRMDDVTFGKLYNTIDKSLRSAEKSGVINTDKCNSTAEWALVRIYQIQNNSKLIRAYDKYKSII